MSISSLITTDLPETPPDSRGSSSETNHAAEAPLVPPPESITSLVNDSALTVTDTEALTAAEQLSSMRSRTDANEDNESITTPAEDESLNSALTNSSTATVKDKGKGKDPELYDINPPEDGNSQDCQVDRSAIRSEAENRLPVPAIENEIDLALSLLDLGDRRYECNTCLDGDPTLGSQCLTVAWRQRASLDYPVSPSPEAKYEPNLYSTDSEDEGARLSTTRPVSPSPVAKYEPNLYSSDSEDEGTPLSTTHKTRFNPSCHGNCLQLSAHEGNAVFDLLPQRNQRHHSHHDGLEVRNGEMRCRRCELVQAHINGRYEQRYPVREYERFERGDTVPLDDDAVNSTAAERLGAAENDGIRDHSVVPSNPPKLSRKTIKRLEAEKRKWKPEPDSLMSTASDPPVSAADTLEPTRLPRYPKRSATRSSVKPTTSINPEATPQQTANEPSPPPPSSDKTNPKTRPTYADRRSSASYPLATNFINLATSISSPYSSPYSPSHTQQNLKPFTPSPLKHAQSAITDTEARGAQSSSTKQQQQQQHKTLRPLATTTKTKNDKGAVLTGGTQPSGPQSQRGGNGRGPVPVNWFSPSPVKYIYGSVDAEKHKSERVFASSPRITLSPPKQTSPLFTNDQAANHVPLTPPSSGRKRKAYTMQAIKGEGEEAEWQGKKYKGKTILSVEQEGMRDALFALHALGE